MIYWHGLDSHETIRSPTYSHGSQNAVKFFTSFREVRKNFDRCFKWFPCGDDEHVIIFCRFIIITQLTYDLMIQRNLVAIFHGFDLFFPPIFSALQWDAKNSFQVSFPTRWMNWHNFHVELILVWKRGKFGSFFYDQTWKCMHSKTSSDHVINFPFLIDFASIKKTQKRICFLKEIITERNRSLPGKLQENLAWQSVPFTIIYSWIFCFMKISMFASRPINARKFMKFWEY